MPFEKGHAKIGGRQVFTRNKRTLGFLEVLEKHKFCAASALIECYDDARKVYENYSVIFKAICEARDQRGLIPVEDKADKYLKMAIECAKELAAYSYPRNKAIEQVKHNPLDGLTAEQKLDAVKQMVKILEMEVGNGQGPIQPTP